MLMLVPSEKNVGLGCELTVGVDCLYTRVGTVDRLWSSRNFYVLWFTTVRWCYSLNFRFNICSLFSVIKVDFTLWDQDLLNI